MADELQISVLLSSIQDLPPVPGDLGDDDSLAIAQKEGQDWQTRKVGYGKIADQLDGRYNLSGLCAVYNDLSNMVGVTRTLTVDLENPYVISAITFEKGAPTALSGYRLSSMMRVVPSPEMSGESVVPVATMWFGGTSAMINIPRGKTNLVTFVRWGLN